jgi:hypothetical protein
VKLRAIIFSPPFEGGVAGTIDFLIFTRSISRPGWLIHFILLTFVTMKNNNFFNRKSIKNFRSSLRNPTSAEVELWNTSTTPAGISICIIIKEWSGHPSFKRRGNFFV